MTTYKVKKGDTLSGIGQRFGVNTQNITGYKSGNPNLIYPGESLTLQQTKQQNVGSTSSQKNPFISTNEGSSKSVASTNGGETGSGGTTGTTGSGETMGTNKYQNFLINQITQQNKYLSDYINTLKNQPSQADQYKQYSEQLGLPQQQKAVTGIQKQVLDVEGLLGKLESDINQRTSPFLVTEAQRRRKLAVEGTPLRTQLSDLMRAESRAKTGYSDTRQQLADMMKMAGLDQAKQEKIAQLPLEYGEKNLPYYKEAYTYESPTDKSKRELAAKLAQESALKKAGVGSYYQAPTKAQTPPASYREWELAGKPGTYADWKKPSKSSSTTDADKKIVEEKRVNDQLTNFGKRGFVSQGWYDKVRRKSTLSGKDFDDRFGNLVLSWDKLIDSQQQQIENFIKKSKSNSLSKAKGDADYLHFLMNKLGISKING